MPEGRDLHPARGEPRKASPDPVAGLSILYCGTAKSNYILDSRPKPLEIHSLEYHSLARNSVMIYI